MMRRQLSCMGIKTPLSYFDDGDWNMRGNQLGGDLELFADPTRWKLDSQPRRLPNAAMEISRSMGDLTLHV